MREYDTNGKALPVDQFFKAGNTESSSGLERQRIDMKKEILCDCCGLNYSAELERCPGCGTKEDC